MTPDLTIVEVGMRDGLQDERRIVPTATKVLLIRRLVAAGLRRIEVASFVHPERVPQMADAEPVVAELGEMPGVSRIGLVLNERGLDRALAAGIDEVGVVVPATDLFGRRNQGMDVDTAVATWERVASRSAAHGVAASVTIAVAYGCPFEGPVAADGVAVLADRLAAAGPVEIALADTIGAAVPTEVSAMVDLVVSRTALPVRAHFHNSRNAGFANAVAAVEAGCVALDASIGGLGGCPSAPGASGNVATEDLVHLLERMGVRTGVDVDALLDVVPDVERVVGHEVPGQLAKSRPFSRSQGVHRVAMSHRQPGG